MALRRWPRSRLQASSSLPPHRLSFIFFSLVPNVSDRFVHTCTHRTRARAGTCIHATEPQRVPAALLASRQPKLAVVSWIHMHSPRGSPPDCARNENETENADLRILLAPSCFRKNLIYPNDSASNNYYVVIRVLKEIMPKVALTFTLDLLFLRVSY